MDFCALRDPHQHETSRYSMTQLHVDCVELHPLKRRGEVSTQLALELIYRLRVLLDTVEPVGTACFIQILDTKRQNAALRVGKGTDRVQSLADRVPAKPFGLEVHALGFRYDGSGQLLGCRAGKFRHLPPPRPADT